MDETLKTIITYVVTFVGGYLSRYIEPRARLDMRGHCREQARLGSEQVIDRLPADPGGLAQLVQSNAVIAALEEKIGGGV